MPVTLLEKVVSGGGSIGSNCRLVKHCYATGTTSKADVENTILADTAFAPETFTQNVMGSVWTYIRDNLECNPIEAPGATGAPTTWECTLSYVLIQFSLQARNAGETQYNFDIGTQSINLKRAIATPQSYKVGGGTAPPDGNLIGWDGQRLRGVDIDIPTFCFSMTCYVADSLVDDAYIAGVYGVMLAPVCNAAFADFDAGEVKFLGVGGTRQGRHGNWQLTFRFAVSPNETSLTIGDTDSGQITGIVKKGWEYLDIQYHKKVLTYAGGTYPVSAIRFARVRQVYGTSDFTALGTGL